ncbi:acyl-CoA dehydrogenase family protein [Corynebacterium guangdongense]|uniref:Alkylation response protein AidB-like acyl-CoA dehydrogenase n=1 Tax=Corynebacterium guangdongense TaxID=1783348 RepID=A0ABU1ZTR8_9CORY|nr:acyl-CoA dehydrogenase family protein [Corynebacterium guangdongense]MDR7328329.1 alkylation response protein AidB-like acyl-CoA dehydrogenase [Corynebacterium guangdongense]WJZ16907.1 Flavin-dependent monooxygenase, oxygenase subunit HsaA [Corynebacterium guangdongense]
MTTTVTTADRVRLNPGYEFEALMERLDGITDLLSANGEKSEELGRLCDESFRALKDTGAFKIGIPEELGGYELKPTQALQVLEKVSRADPASGWVLMVLQMISGTTAAYLPEEAQRELFPANGEHALVAGQGTRFGKAERVDGGYRISGNWFFGSGMLHANWIHTGAIDHESGRVMMVHFPRDKASLDGNWDVLGLRASGSIDYSCDDVFVPEEYVYEPNTTDPLAGGALYKTGLALMSGICHTGWALGVGQRFLDEMKRHAAKKKGQPGASTNTDQFHAEYAKAEARMRSARAWAMEVWGGNERALDAGEKLTMEQETLTRLVLNNTTWAAHDVSQVVHLWSATALARRGDLQRTFRDMHVGTGHMTSGPVVLQQVGKYLAGLASEDAHWNFFSLAESDQS